VTSALQTRPCKHQTRSRDLDSKDSDLKSIRVQFLSLKAKTSPKPPVLGADLRMTLLEFRHVFVAKKAKALKLHSSVDCLIIGSAVFTARRYASAVYAAVVMYPSVCLSDTSRSSTKIAIKSKSRSLASKS